jgi:hypothetical protein
MAALGLGGEITRACRNIYRHGNVFVNDQPLATNLAMGVGHAYGDVHFFAILVIPDRVVDAVRQSQFAMMASISLALNAARKRSSIALISLAPLDSASARCVPIKPMSNVPSKKAVFFMSSIPFVLR